MATCWQGLWAYRSYLIVVLMPVLLLPLPILVPTKVRAWGSGHREAPSAQGKDCGGQGLGILRTSITYSPLLACEAITS